MTFDRGRGEIKKSQQLLIMVEYYLMSYVLDKLKTNTTVY